MQTKQTNTLTPLLLHKIDAYWRAANNLSVGHICDADSILIVGPGTAKHELQKRLEENRLGAKVVGVETVDLLMEPQLVAKIRQHFSK